MNLNDLINDYVETKNKREDLSEEVKACTEKLARLEADIMSQMSHAGLVTAASDKASCTMKEVRHPAIKDWNIFYQHVAKTKQFELLHKRLASAAFRERWEAGEVVPGTEVSNVWELSVRRK